MTCDPAQDAGKKGLPDELLTSAFIELRLEPRVDEPTGEYRYDKEFALGFYRAVPLLAAASHDIRRVNRFAPVLAMFRWSKGQPGVEFADIPARPKSAVPTPDALVTSQVTGGRWPLDEVIRPVLPPDPKRDRADLRERIEGRMKELEKTEPVAQAVRGFVAADLEAFDKKAGGGDLGDAVLKKSCDKLVPAGLKPEAESAVRYWLELRALRALLSALPE